MKKTYRKVQPKVGFDMAFAAGGMNPQGAYTIVWITDPIDEANQTAGAIAVTGCETGGRYELIVSGSGADPIVRTGTVTAPGGDFNITLLDCSVFDDGILTARFRAQVDEGGHWIWAYPVTADVVKDTA